MAKISYISIGQLAQRTGTSVSAIRFYADEGIIPFVRMDSGHRSFNREVIRRVSFILISQNLGYSLKEISNALESLPNNRTPTKADWTRLSKRFSTEIDVKINQLQQLKNSLDGCIGCGCLSLKRCHLYNPKDAAKGFGVGPRYLLGNNAKDVLPN